MQNALSREQVWIEFAHAVDNVLGEPEGTKDRALLLDGLQGGPSDVREAVAAIERQAKRAAAEAWWTWYYARGMRVLIDAGVEGHALASVPPLPEA